MRQYFVGIDVSKRCHTAAVVDEDGQLRLKDFEFHDDAAGYARLLEALLDAPQGDALPALRDRALLGVMVRNGLRAAEVVGLTIGDLGEDQGFRVATIRGKGKRARTAKLAGPTWEALKAWLDAGQRWASGEAAPVFVRLRKYGRNEHARWLAWEAPMSTQALTQIVGKWAKAAWCAATPPSPCGDSTMLCPPNSWASTSGWACSATRSPLSMPAALSRPTRDECSGLELQLCSLLEVT